MEYADPNPEHAAFHAEALELSNQIAQELIPEFSFDGATTDLKMLQSILDAGLLQQAADPISLLKCLGVAFGEVLRASLPGTAWCSVTDEYGCDLALRYAQTSVVLFPVTMLSKRVEEQRALEIEPLHDGIVEKVRAMIASGEYK